MKFTIKTKTVCPECPGLEVFFLVLLFFIIFIFPATRTIGIDRDSKIYEIGVLEAIQDNFENSITGSREPTFFLITYISNLVFSDPVRGVLIIYAFIAVALKVMAMYKLSDFFFVSICIYLAFFYFLHEFTTIRAGVASGIFLLSYEDIKNKKLSRYIFKILIATLFHYSAIILIIFYFVNNSFIKKHLNLLIVLCILFDILRINVLFLTLISKISPSFISVKLNIYISLLKSGQYTSVSTQRLLFNYGFLLIIFFCEKISVLKNDKKLMNYLDIFKISVAFFFFSKCIPVLAARVSEMTSIYLVFLIPSIIKHIKKTERRLVILIFLLLLIPFFVMYIISYYPFYKII